MNLTKTATRLVTIAALALLVLTQARTASAAHRHHVKKGITATVRNTRNGFVLGTLFSREAIDIRCKVGSYGYGHAYGDVDRSGWVYLDRTDRPKLPKGSAGIPTCSKPYPFISLRSFMRRLTNDRYGRTVEKNSVTCRGGGQSKCDGNETNLRQGVARTRVFFNLRSGAGVNRHSVEIGRATPVFWRYVTRDNNHVLVRAVISGESRWGFIKREHMPTSDRLPVFDTCIYPRKARPSCGPD